MRPDVQWLNAASPLDAALYYAGRGWAVYPVSRQGDIPLNHEPATGLVPAREKVGSTDPATIRSWYERWPYAQVAIKTGGGKQMVRGMVKSGLVAVRLMAPAGVDAEAAVRERYNLPETLTARNGRFLDRYYLWPEDQPDPVTYIKRLVPSVRAALSGGCMGIPAPPSIADGQPVRWVNDLSPAPAPDWLVKAQTRDETMIPARRISDDAIRRAREAEAYGLDATKLAERDLKADQQHKARIARAAERFAEGFAGSAVRPQAPSTDTGRDREQEFIDRYVERARQRFDARIEARKKELRLCHD